MEHWSVSWMVTTSAIFELMHSTPVSCSEVGNFCVREVDGVLIPATRFNFPGYAFGLIIEACTKHQEKHKPTQGDPIQLSSHYLLGPALVPYEVHLRTLKSGRSYTNIYAEFRQEVPLVSPSTI